MTETDSQHLAAWRSALAQARVRRIEAERRGEADSRTMTVDDEPQGEGDCFSVALHLVTWGGQLKDDDTAVVCHGVVSRPGDGLRHSHAWVETTQTVRLPDFPAITITICHDYSNGNSVGLPAQMYYKLGEIDDVVRYTPAGAARLAIEHGHYGPWPAD